SEINREERRTGGPRVFYGSPRLRRARETRELASDGPPSHVRQREPPKISPSRTSRPPRLPVNSGARRRQSSQRMARDASAGRTGLPDDATVVSAIRAADWQPKD